MMSQARLIVANRCSRLLESSPPNWDWSGSEIDLEHNLEIVHNTVLIVKMKWSVQYE